MASGTHLTPDELNEIDGTGHVGIDDVPNIGKVLVEKRASEAVARVRQQRIYGTASRRRPESVDTTDGGELSFDHGRLCTEVAKSVGGCVNFRLIRRDQQVESLLRADRREFKADSG